MLQYVRGTHHVGLMFIDLDNFKHYNDTFGHDVGDLILKEMAKIFRKGGKGKRICRQIWRDEFIMILNTDAREILEQIAKGIYEKINSTQGFQRQIENYRPCDHDDRKIADYLFHRNRKKTGDVRKRGRY